MEVLVASAGTFLTKYELDRLEKPITYLESYRDYRILPPEVFDGTHGYPLAYKRSFVAKDFVWDTDSEDEEPIWVKNAIERRMGTERGKKALLYYSIQVEAWFVDLSPEMIVEILKRWDDCRLGFNKHSESLVLLVDDDQSPIWAFNELGWGRWNKSWLHE